MTFWQVITYAAIGKLIIFTLQRFPFSHVAFIGKLFTGDRFFAKLFGCDFCLGFWVFTALAPLFGANLVEQFYVPIVSWAITGVIMSFIVHVFSNGWKALYNVTVIGGN